MSCIANILACLAPPAPQNEYEMSVWNMDEADVADQRQRFELFDAGEAHVAVDGYTGNIG